MTNRIRPKFNFPDQTNASPFQFVPDVGCLVIVNSRDPVSTQTVYFLEADADDVTGDVSLQALDLEDGTVLGPSFGVEDFPRALYTSFGLSLTLSPDEEHLIALGNNNDGNWQLDKISLTGSSEWSMTISEAVIDAQIAWALPDRTVVVYAKTGSTHNLHLYNEFLNTEITAGNYPVNLSTLTGAGATHRMLIHNTPAGHYYVGVKGFLNGTPNDVIKFNADGSVAWTHTPALTTKLFDSIYEGAEGVYYTQANRVTKLNAGTGVEVTTGGWPHTFSANTFSVTYGIWGDGSGGLYYGVNDERPGEDGKKVARAAESSVVADSVNWVSAHAETISGGGIGYQLRADSDGNVIKPSFANGTGITKVQAADGATLWTTAYPNNPDDGYATYYHGVVVAGRVSFDHYVRALNMSTGSEYVTSQYPKTQVEPEYSYDITTNLTLPFWYWSYSSDATPNARQNRIGKFSPNGVLLKELTPPDSTIGFYQILALSNDRILLAHVIADADGETGTATQKAIYEYDQDLNPVNSGSYPLTGLGTSLSEWVAGPGYWGTTRYDPFNPTSQGFTVFSNAGVMQWTKDGVAGNWFAHDMALTSDYAYAFQSNSFFPASPANADYIRKYNINTGVEVTTNGWPIKTDGSAGSSWSSSNKFLYRGLVIDGYLYAFGLAGGWDLYVWDVTDVGTDGDVHTKYETNLTNAPLRYMWDGGDRIYYYSNPVGAPSLLGAVTIPTGTQQFLSSWGELTEFPIGDSGSLSGMGIVLSRATQLVYGLINFDDDEWEIGFATAAETLTDVTGSPSLGMAEPRAGDGWYEMQVGDGSFLYSYYVGDNGGGSREVGIGRRTLANPGVDAVTKITYVPSGTTNLRVRQLAAHAVMLDGAGKFYLMRLGDDEVLRLYRYDATTLVLDGTYTTHSFSINSWRGNPTGDRNGSGHMTRLLTDGTFLLARKTSQTTFEVGRFDPVAKTFDYQTAGTSTVGAGDDDPHISIFDEAADAFWMVFNKTESIYKFTLSTGVEVTTGGWPFSYGALQDVETVTYDKGFIYATLAVTPYKVIKVRGSDGTVEWEASPPTGELYFHPRVSDAGRLLVARSNLAEGELIDVLDLSDGSVIAKYRHTFNSITNFTMVENFTLDCA